MILRELEIASILQREKRPHTGRVVVAGEVRGGLGEDKGEEIVGSINNEVVIR